MPFGSTLFIASRRTMNAARWERYAPVGIGLEDMFKRLDAVQLLPEATHLIISSRPMTTHKSFRSLSQGSQEMILRFLSNEESSQSRLLCPKTLKSEPTYIEELPNGTLPETGNSLITPLSKTPPILTDCSELLFD